MPIRALIVDDEVTIREAAEISLRVVGGWDVVTAGSGAEGLAIAQQQGATLDVILLDQMMPGMTGVDVFEALRAEADTCDIPVIFLTAKVQPSDRERFASMGVAHVVPKPFDAMTLASTLEHALKGSA